MKTSEALSRVAKKRGNCSPHVLATEFFKHLLAGGAEAPGRDLAVEDVDGGPDQHHLPAASSSGGIEEADAKSP
jgi:hypothetical protein